MSNAKWRKVFHALCGAPGVVGNCRLRTIFGWEGEFPIWNVSPDQADDEFMEDHVADGKLGSPIHYREIEWIEFPATWTVQPDPHRAARQASQDIASIQAIIDSQGLLETDVVDGALRLYGYR